MCIHSEGLSIDIPAKTPNGCEECLKEGTQWVHLRKCLVCGHIGCCDSSQGRHATRHFQKTHSHNVMTSFPDLSWKWCYIDNEYV